MLLLHPFEVPAKECKRHPASNIRRDCAMGDIASGVCRPDLPLEAALKHEGYGEMTGDMVA